MRDSRLKLIFVDAILKFLKSKQNYMKIKHAIVTAPQFYRNFLNTIFSLLIVEAIGDMLGDMLGHCVLYQFNYPRGYFMTII